MVQFGPEQFKQLQTHGQENKKKEAFLLAFSKQQVVVCKAQAFKIQMLKTKFSGLDSNIIYKAQISLFTHVTVNRVVAGGGAGAAVVVVALLQIHLC